MCVAMQCAGALRRRLGALAVRQISSSRKRIPRYGCTFETADRLFGLVLPTLGTNDFHVLEDATVLLAHGNHYLVATEGLKQVGCVQLNRPAVFIGHDPKQADSLFAALVSNVDTVEHGVVQSWPVLEGLNNSGMPKYGTILEPRSYRHKPRHVVRLTFTDDPEKALYFFLYMCPTPSSLARHLATSKVCWLSQSIGSRPEFASCQPVVYFPHAHLARGEWPKFTRHDTLSNEEKQEFLFAFSGAHASRRSPTNPSQDDMHALERHTSGWLYPQGYHVVSDSTSDSDEDPVFY